MNAHSLLLRIAALQQGNAAMALTPRQNFKAAMDHTGPEWVPLDMGKHIGSIHKNHYGALAPLLPGLELKNGALILDRMAQTVVPDEALLRHFKPRPIRKLSTAAANSASLLSVFVFVFVWFLSRSRYPVSVSVCRHCLDTVSDMPVRSIGCLRRTVFS